MRTLQQIKTRIRAALRRSLTTDMNLFSDEVELQLYYPELTDEQALKLYNNIVLPFKRGELK